MSKNHTAIIKTRDALLDVKGLSAEACGVYFKFWMLHHLHGEPLPPKEEKKPRDEWDEWFRDALDMKNVRTWRRSRDELLAKARIREDADGRLYIGRTKRDLKDKKRWNGATDDGQPSLDLQPPTARPAPSNDDDDAQVAVGNPVDAVGEPAASTEVRANIDRTSPDVRPKLPAKWLIFHETRPLYSYSQSNSLHEFVVAVPFAAARARDGPQALRA